MATKTKTVTIETAAVGQAFGVCAIVRDERTGRKLATTRVRPHGFDASALADGESLAAERGWLVAVAS